MRLTNLKPRVRSAVARFDALAQTQALRAIPAAVRLAGCATGFERLRFLAVGLRYAWDRDTGTQVVKLPLGGGHVPIVLPDFAAFLVLEEIFALEQYRRESGPDPQVILDLGANVGASAFYYRQTFPAARIICVEADPNLIPVLKQNGIQLDVEVVHAAVAATAGNVEFYVAESSWAGSILPERGSTAHAVSVPAVTLDDLIEAYRPELIKVDIEGAEHEVFAASHLTSSVRVIVGEIHSAAGDPRTKSLLGRLADFCLDVEEYGDFTLFRAIRASTP
jgi:FkbM family methyltransferase